MLMLLVGFIAIVAAVADDVLSVNVELLLRAIDDAQLTELQFCQEIGIGQPRWCAWKKGEEHISLTRLMTVPDVLSNYCLLYLSEVRFPARAQRMAKAALGVSAHRLLNGKERTA